jgi:hypothetical protein
MLRSGAKLELHFCHGDYLAPALLHGIAYRAEFYELSAA